MLKALNIATQGLMQAERRATDLARDILQTSSKAASSFSLKDDANSAAIASATSGTGKPAANLSDNLIQQLVDLQATELSFKANAKVFERTKDMLGTLLDDEG